MGRPDASIPQDIVLIGAHILSEHCIFENKQNEYVELKPCNSALCYVNGKKIEVTVSLKTGDRVIFGNSHVFRFNNPEQARKEKITGTLPTAASSLSSTTTQMNESITSESVDWVSATQELKEKQGIDIKHEMDRYFFFTYFIIFINKFVLKFLTK